MNGTSFAIRLLALAATAAACALPWSEGRLPSILDGLELALPGALTALALVATLVATARRSPMAPFTSTAWSWSLPTLTLLGAGPIAAAWRSGRSNGAFLMGVIPYSDAGDYVQGALRLLSEGALEPWSCRRPLNTSLLAARLALVGHSIEGALVLQALLLAVAASLAARAVALDHGRRAGLTAGAAVMTFGAIYTPTTMSEALGLTLGALAAAMLWHSSRTGNAWHFGAGMSALTVALNARSGPFFALATLLLWSLRDLRASPRRALTRAGHGALGVALAFGFNRGLLAAHGGAASGMHGNFSYTLWGLAHGGLPWDRALTRHPEVLRMSDGEAAAFLYARALEQLRAHPTALLRGLWVNVYELVAMVMDPLSGGRLHDHPALATTLFVAMLSPCAWLAWRALRAAPDHSAMGMALAGSAGVALSVPVIFLDGRVRVFAAGFPLGILAVVALVAAGRRATPAPVEAHRRAFESPSLLFVVLLLASIVGPRLGRRHPNGAEVTCRAGEAAFALWTEGAPLARRVIDGGADVSAGRVPRNTLLARIARDPNLGYTLLDEQLRALRVGDTVVAGLDLRSHGLEYYVFPIALAPPRRRVVRGCAARPRQEFRQFRRVTQVR